MSSTLSLHDRESLFLFAHSHGRAWRADLRKIWNSPHEMSWHRRVRNILGPSGLSRVKPMDLL